MIGQTITHYKVTAKLGEGGMGEVFLAEDTHLDRKVALKFLPRHFSTDPEARTRFQREAKALAALNHPNIVAVYEVGEHDGQPFIAMEYVEGESLKKLIASGNVGVGKALDLVAQASEALAAAHKREIIHRDIKSENIVLSSEGRVKVMDFGLATWRGVTKITAENSTMGTRAYMSPEQSLGQKVDHRADLWSLGVVLYELIAGRLPFTGEHDSAIAYSISNETPEPLARYKADVSPELQRIVSKCLAKSPDERYQSAADLTADLRVLRSTGSTPVFREATSPRGKLRIVPILSVAVVAIVAIVAGSIWQPFNEESMDTTASRKMLAVLPFENLGPKDQEYFADGMTEEITSRLASISGLGVISRTSVMQYKENKKPLREIGAELGVEYVIEGTVRWDHVGDTDYVRVTPQLIKVKDDTHLWSDRFERPLERIFALQADIAEQVVAALDITLLASERKSLAYQPVVNEDAYKYYLRGRELYDRLGNNETAQPAIEMFERAVAIDSGFALAYAGLSLAKSRNYTNLIWYEAAQPDDCDKAKEFGELALRLAPNFAEAHLALGYYHRRCQLDKEAASAEFAIAESLQPNNSDMILASYGALAANGKWSESLEKIQRAQNLDPLSPWKMLTLAGAYAIRRRYAAADSVLSRIVSLYPELLDAYVNLALLRMGATGDPSTATAMLDTAASRTKLLPGMVEYFARMSPDYVPTLDDELRRLEDEDLTPNDRARLHVDIGETYEELGQIQASHEHFDSAYAILGERPDSTILQTGFQTVRLYTQLFSSVGRESDAIRIARSYYLQVPLSVDGEEGENRLALLISTYIKCGEEDLALDGIDTLLAMPSSWSVGLLRGSPQFDPLRKNPRFQALIDRGDIVF